MHFGLTGTRAGIAVDVLVGQSQDTVKKELRASTSLGVESERVGVEIVCQGHDAKLLII
jgi:hypothetical protein